MRRVQLSLSTMLLLVLVLAVDIGWARQTIKTRKSLIGLEAPAFDTGVISMLTALVFTNRLRKAGPFFVGFQAGGVLAIFTFAWIARYQPDWIRAYANPLVWGVASYLGMDRHGDAIIFTMDAVIFLPPQLALAFASGMLAKFVLPLLSSLSTGDRPVQQDLP
jgi:hypothetical protein